MEAKPSLAQRLKTLVIGGARSPYDKAVFQKLSLIAFFAWVGLGSDGLSSSAYGPEEAFLALQGHIYLGIFIALGSALTVFVISASYSQIVELFPTGGGGYLVASKLLSPTFGMIAGCALIIDYVLTITISIASGADAIFSFLPREYHSFKLPLATLGVVILILLNLRGIREAVVPLVPIFLIFILTHAFLLVYGIGVNVTSFPNVVEQTATEVQKVSSEMGMAGLLFLVLRAYSMGAGTYTGIEAVSNALPILRHPRVETAKRTMRYMAISLASVVLGLTFGYVLYKVEPQAGKTLNAVLFEQIALDWGGTFGYSFVLTALLAEAAILFLAAQTGFLGGPRVIANMALDRWLPTRFATLSDRFVTQNGILIMGAAALATMLLTHGSVHLLVVLYSINVFITFVLSQLGMVRHWWSHPKVKGRSRKLLVNGVGFVLTAFILVAVTVLKFHEGGWITLLVTGLLVGIVIIIRRHYNYTARLLRSLDRLLVEAASPRSEVIPTRTQDAKSHPQFDPKSKTAVLLVNGYNGLGLHILLNLVRTFEESFKNFVFLQIGIIDAGNFKGSAEIGRLQKHVKNEVDRYVKFMERHGYYAEGVSAIGIDVVDEISEMAPKILERFPQAVFFGGQVVFPKDSFLSRWLHNYTAFGVQRRLYHQGIPVIILPIRV